MNPKPFTVKFFMDGNQWCAVFDNFTNLQECPAGFGDTIFEALDNLLDGEATGVPSA
jgi:hypothetical protein